MWRKDWKKVRIEVDQLRGYCSNLYRPGIIVIWTMVVAEEMERSRWVQGMFGG